MFAINLNIINDDVQHNQMIPDCRTVWQRRMKNREKTPLFNLSDNEFCWNSLFLKIFLILQGDPFKMSQTSGVAPCKRRF